MRLFARINTRHYWCTASCYHYRNFLVQYSHKVTSLSVSDLSISEPSRSRRSHKNTTRLRRSCFRPSLFAQLSARSSYDLVDNVSSIDSRRTNQYRYTMTASEIQQHQNREMTLFNQLIKNTVRRVIVLTIMSVPC